MNIVQIRYLAKEFYLTFYLDLHPRKFGFLGGLSYISWVCFIFFLLSSAYLYSIGLPPAAFSIFGMAVFFEILGLLFMRLESKDQVAKALMAQGIVSSLNTYDQKNMNNYKRVWLCRKMNCDVMALAKICMVFEETYLKMKNYEDRAIGSYGKSMGKFFSLPKERVIALSIALISILIAIMGSGSFTLDGFFIFMGILLTT